jgi:Flp pilus assembly protein TadB
MKTHLPAPEEYYRLTRARELREKVRRLDWRWWLLPVLWLTIAAWLVWTGERKVFAIANGIMSIALLLFRWWERQRDRRLLEEAEALEAEHQARYGELPPGETP